MRKTRHTVLLFSMSMVLSTLVITSAYATVVEQCGGGTIDSNAEDGIDFSSGCGEINSSIGTISGDIKLSGTAELYINANITTITGKIDISGNAVLHLASGVTISDLQNDFLIYDDGAANISGTIYAQKKMELSDNAYVTMDGGTFESSNGDILIKEGTTLDMQNASSIKIPGNKKIEIKSTGSLLSDGTGNSIDGPIEDEPGSNIPLFLQYCSGSPCVEAPGFIIIETGGSNEVVEGGGDDSFNVFLIYEPSSNVVLNIVSDDVTEFSVSPSTLTFTPSNFLDQQTVTITPVEDVVNDNEIVTTATVSVNDALSANEYDPVLDQTPTVTIFDNDFEIPATTDFTKTTDEDTEVFVAYADLSYSDPDGQAMDQLEVVTVPAKGTLFRDTSPFGTFDGTDIVLGNGSTLTYNQINSGRLGFLPDANEIGAPYTTFTYRVYDEATTYSSGSDFSNTQTVTIDVNSLNDPPAFSTSGDVSVLEDFAAQQTVTVTPGPVPTDEAAQTVTYALSPATVSFATIGFNTSTGEVTIDAVSNGNGSQLFTITADDGQGANNTATDTFTLTVNAENDDPTISAIADQSTDEDVTKTGIAFTVDEGGDSDEDVQVLTVTATSSNTTLVPNGNIVVNYADNGSGSANALSPTLDITPTADLSGSTTITVTVQDDGVGSPSITEIFILTVNAVNDPPTITVPASQQVNEDNIIEDIAFFVDEGGGTDENVQTLTVTMTSSDQSIVKNSNIVHNYADNGVNSAHLRSPVIDITPEPNAFGVVSINISVQDNGSGTPTTVGSFQLTVRPVNDQPNFVAGLDVIVDEDFGSYTSGWATSISKGPANESDQVLTFSVVNDNNALFDVQPAISASGVLTFTTKANAFGQADVDVYLYDNGGLLYGGADTSPTESFTIELNEINDIPTSADQAVSVATSATYTFSIADFSDQYFDVEGDPFDGIRIVERSGITAGSLTYNLVAVSSDNFYVSSGNLSKLRYNAPGAGGTMSFTFKVEDDNNDGFSVETYTMYIVIGAPGLPTGASINKVIDEDFKYSFQATEFQAGYSHPNNVPLDAIKVTGLESAGSLKVNGGDVTVNKVIYLTEMGMNKFQFTPGSNQNGNTYDSFNFKVLDVAGNESAATYTYTFDVTALNDAPVFTLIGDEFAYDEEGAQTIANFMTGQNDGDPELTQVLSVEISNTKNDLFDVQPAIDVTTGQLTYTPADKANGLAIVSVTLRDDGGTVNGGSDATVKTFKITIMDGASTTPTTIPAGSYIVDMGNPTGLGDGLKPYGLVFDLTSNYEVPVSIAINVNKAKDGIDFSHEGVDYKGAPFIISQEYITPTIAAVIASWEDNGSKVGGSGKPGVEGNYTTTNALNVPIYVTFSSYPKWTLDTENAGIAIGYFDLAGIPASAYKTAYPYELDVTDDIFVMPHADPSWDDHSNLYYWNQSIENGGQSGWIWAGCHAVSVLENLSNPNNPTEKMNFLSDPALLHYSIDGHATGSGPYSYRYPGHQFMQFVGSYDGATNNGSEQIYLPKLNGEWRESSQVAMYDPDHSDIPANSPGEAAKMVFGPAFGDPANGMVLYQGGHSLEAGTDLEKAAAIRAFLNFSFLAPVAKVPVTSSFFVPDEMGQGVSYGLIIDAAGRDGSTPAYEWTASCGGTFDDNTSATPNYIPPAVGSSTACLISVKITDSFGRQSFETHNVTILATNAPTFTSFTSPVKTTNEDVEIEITFNEFLTASNASDTDGTILAFIAQSELVGTLKIGADVASATPFDENNDRIDATNKAYWTPPSDYFGTTDFAKFTAQDDLGANSTTLVTGQMTVNSVNDAPSFAKGNNQEIDEDTGSQTIVGWATSLDVGPANESGQTLSFNVSNDNNSLFSTQPAIASNGDLTYTPAADANGVATVTVSISDDGGGTDTSADQTFTITVNAVNDIPSFTKGADESVNEDAGAQTVTSWATAISAGPADESGQTLSFNVSNDNNSLFSTQPAIASNGDLTYTPAADANGVATVTVSISDDGGGTDTSADQTFTITVNPVAAYALSTTLITTNEGSNTTFTIVLESTPNSNVTIDISSSDASAASVDLASVSFDNTDWNTPQTITITGEQDTDLNDETVTITAAINAASSDNNFDGLADQTVTASITDDDAAGFTLSTTTVSTTEGSTTTFTIVLDAEPNSNVTIDISSDDAGAASVDLASVSFDNTDWNTPQTITITGEQDTDLNDETVTITATINDATSDDNFDALADQTVTATITEDDTAGFTLSTTTVSTTEGSTTTFTIVLDAEPNSNVTIDISSDDAGAASVDLASVSFDNTDWNTPQTITVTGEQDTDLNNETVTITATINQATSDDNFDGLADQTVTASITDDDIAGFTLSTTTVSTTEGSTTTFTIVLDAEPNSNVTINVSSDDAGAASLDVMTVTFDNTDWNTPQTITVTGEQDTDLNDETVTITAAINDATSDDNFDGLADQTVTASITDDDAAGFTLSTTTVNTTEGSTTTFTIVLDAEPNSNVTINVSSDDAGAASVDLASVSFDTTDWNTPQTITVTGEQDTDLNNETVTITAAINDATSDDNFDGLADQTVTASITDDDAAGFTLSTTTVNTTEGSTTTFTIVLDAEPNSNVTINVSSDDAGAASVDLASVSFDNTDWNTPQTITVTGEQDTDLNNETVTITATINDATSDDNFDGLADQTVTATITDDDNAGFTLSTTTVSTTEGSTTSFTIVLDAEPNSNVTINVSSDDAGAASVDLASVSFDNTDWNTPQTITVTGEQDTDLNNETVTITAAINAATSDDNFDGLADQTVTATITDDDNAGFTLSTTTVSTTEGSTTSFTIVLDAEPNSNVTIDISSDDAGAASVDLASVSFDNTDWNTPKTITVTGEQDTDLNNETVTITATINDATSDDNFDGLADQTVTASITEDDAAGFTLSTTTVSTTEGSTTTFTIVLDAEPNSNVTIDISSDDAGAASVDLASVSFDNTDWNTPQTITITGEQDTDLNNETVTITATINQATSDDNFDGLADQTVTASITEDDAAGFTLSTTTVSTTEGSTTSFTIVLDAEPNSNVTIDVSSDDAGAASVDLASVSFDNTDWNTPQTITVTGEQDTDLNNETVTITAAINAATSDDNFDALADQTVTATITDDDNAGFTLSTTTVNTTEGSTTTFTIVLDAEPNSNVTINVSSDDAGAASVDLASVSFDNTDWNTPQTITVTGEQDTDLSDETVTITAAINTASSDDNFDGLADQNVTASINDDDAAGFTLSTTTVSTTEGSTTTFTIVLDAEPNSNVTINVSSDDAGAASVDLASVSFDNTDWNTPQTITITGEQDTDLNNETVTITAAINQASSDDNFDGLADQTVTASITDDDAAGFTLSTTTVSTTEGSTTTFTIVLDAEPNSNVTIDISSDDAGAASLDVTTVSFDNTDWNTPQTITITGEQDTDLNNETVTITATINQATSDDNFDGLADQTVTASITEDDAAGFTLSTTTVSTTEGSTTTFTIVLDAEPNSNVTIDISSDDAGAASVDLASVSFDNTDWNTPQTITITGEQDTDLNNETVTITAAINDATSDDNFDALADQTVTASITEDDAAGFTLSTTTVSTTEGSTTTFTIVLDAEPNSNVTIDISSDDAGAASVDLASVSFDNTDWNTPQTITVTGEQDTDLNNETVTITAAINDATSDDNFDALADQTVTATITDDDAAGFTVVESGGSTITTEGGSSDSFTVTLDAQPVNPVIINLSSGSVSEISLDASVLTFTNADWNVAQTVNVIGQDDAVDDGDVAIGVTLSIDASSDAAFTSLPNQLVSVTNVDNDAPGVTITPVAGLIVNESGNTATFIIELQSEPTADVNIVLSSSDSGEGTVSPTSFTLNASNWNGTNAFTVTGVNDDLVDGDINFMIITSALSSSDPSYSGIDPVDVGVTNEDDDAAGFTLSTTTVSTTEGSTTSFTIVLDAEPNSNVTIDISSDDAGAASVDLTSVNFDNTDWNTPKTITVTGEQDTDLNNETVTITASINDATSDDNFDALADQIVTASITDDDVESFTVTETGGTSVTSESGSTDSFDVVLDAQPNTNVIINITADDATEHSVDNTNLIFTNTNWNVAQTVTITGLDDSVDDGDVVSTITLSIDAASDINFTGLSDQIINVTNVDDDAPGITISPVSGLNVSETGTTSAFTIELQSSPVSDVLIDFSSDNTAEGTVSPSSFTFNSSNWNNPQTITVTGVDDILVDGDINFKIITSAAVSTDPSYSGLNPIDIAVTNMDDDAASFTVSAISGNTTESGGAATFTVVLDAQPLTDVVFDITSGDLSEGTVDLTTLTFTNTNWNVTQTITVTGVDDALQDGDMFYDVTVAIDPTLSDDAFDLVPDRTVNVTNTDDDTAGFMLSTETVSTNEGMTTSFTIVLRAMPDSNVFIDLSSDDIGAASLSPSSIGFDNTDWNMAKTITVTGEQDDDLNNETVTITVSINAVASDDNFDALADQTVTASITDDDVAGFTMSTNSISVTEDGSNTFTVALDNQPNGDVTLNISSTDVVSLDLAAITFTPANWNTPQTITVFGEETKKQNDVAGSITLTVSGTSSSEFVGLTDEVVSVTVSSLNDQPIITSHPPRTVTSGISFEIGLTDITVTDPDNNFPDDFTLTILPSSDYEVDNNSVIVRASFAGFMDIMISVNDGALESAIYAYTVNVESGENVPPTILSQQSLQTEEDVSITISLLDITVEDADNSMDELTLVINEGVNYEFIGDQIIPSENFNGNLTVSIQVSDGTDLSAVFDLTILVTPVNDAPVVGDDTYEVALGMELSINVVTNDTDVDSNLLSVTPLESNDDRFEFDLSSNGELKFTSINMLGDFNQFYEVCDDANPQACSQGLITITVVSADFDLDGIPDDLEVVNGDTDDDGILDYMDTDSDDDGISDEVEAGSNPLTPVDSDGDATPDYLDLDSDNDGKLDSEEGTEDCDKDGLANYVDDSDICLLLTGPQGFSPNGDGINDSWMIEGIEAFPENRVIIFNRWGSTVSEIDNYNNLDRVWLGKNLNEKSVPDGTYFYTISIKNQINPIKKLNQISGFIVISR